MKKKYKLENIDCANCAAKIERNIKLIDGVLDANLNFMGLRLIVDVEDSKADGLLQKMLDVSRKVEPDIKIKEI